GFRRADRQRDPGCRPERTRRQDRRREDLHPAPGRLHPYPDRGAGPGGDLTGRERSRAGAWPRPFGCPPARAPLRSWPWSTNHCWGTMIQAVIFDFNGVLVDDEVVHFELFREVLAQERVVITDRDYHERYLGYDDRGCFAA